MRYIGNKTRLLENIENLINEKGITQGTFADLFTGTGSVADHFKDRFTIIANDIEKYSSIFAEAKIKNSTVPDFKKFVREYRESPFDFFNNIPDNQLTSDGFITQNYTPIGGRMFFQENNAKRIDFIRYKIDDLISQNLISHDEYIFLLASLLESVMRVSNTSGTYEAFFKTWESRSRKPFKLEPLTMEARPVKSPVKNTVYTEDANTLARQINGDVVYIDTPYTVTQYASAYHLLETLALNDDPQLIGKTGRRKPRKMSEYNRRGKAADQFNDLFRQLNFKHVIVSYSNQSLVPLDKLISIIKSYAIPGSIDVRKIDFREYSNLNKSHKGNGKQLQEVLIYFQKDLNVIKSPLNYAGSKDSIVPIIIKNIPRKVSTFVDGMAGACNVGININGVRNVVFNEKQQLIVELNKKLLTMPTSDIVKKVNTIIDFYGLEKSNKEAYLKLRSAFNADPFETKDVFKLFVLSLYSFQHMIRFNRKGEFNVPVGNSGMNTKVMDRIKNFRAKGDKGNYTFYNDDIQFLDYKQFDKDSLFYFDPPYIITSASYNDGNRMNVKWTDEDETNLLNYMDSLNQDGYKFLLSNVLVHHGKTNEKLKKWIHDNHYECIKIGQTGRRFPRVEILVRNY